MIRFVQETRKASGLDVSDRIHLRWSAEGLLAQAIERYSDQISREVLAVDMERADPSSDWVSDEDLALKVSVTKR